MSSYVKAMQVLLGHPLFERLLGPIFHPGNESIEWSALNYGVLSGGEKAAISWAYSIWCNGPVPKGWRCPFEGYGTMDVQLQRLVVMALLTRHR